MIKVWGTLMQSLKMILLKTFNGKYNMLGKIHIIKYYTHLWKYIFILNKSIGISEWVYSYMNTKTCRYNWKKTKMHRKCQLYHLGRGVLYFVFCFIFVHIYSLNALQ